MTELFPPLVSIVIPTDKQGSFLAATLQSALDQTVDNVEILVANNAPAQESGKEIAELALKHPCVVVHNFDELLWPVENLNRSLGLAKGQYVVFLLPGDLLKPKFLQGCLDIYKIRPDLGYVSCETGTKRISGQDGDIIHGLDALEDNLLRCNTRLTPMLMRTQCLREVGGFCYSDIYPVLMMNMKWDVGFSNLELVQSKSLLGTTTQGFLENKTLLMSLFLSKIMVMEYYLPDEAMHLKTKKLQVKKQFAHDCLEHYCLEALAANNQQLCREYLALAQNFWLGIDKAPAYAFVEQACGRGGWTLEALQDAWQSEFLV